MKTHRSRSPFHRSMRGAALRNRILGFSGTLAFLAAIVFVELGCSSGPTASSEPVATVTVTGPDVVEVGHTIQLTATTYRTGGLEVTGRTVTWSSSDPNEANVSNTGLVTGVSAGTGIGGGVVTITATSEGKQGTKLVLVTLPPVATVTIDPPAASIPVDGTVQLFADLADASANPLPNLNRVVNWSSSLPNVASVSGSGLVTGESAGGPVTITATSEGKSGTAQVTVTPPPVATVTVAGPATVPVNGTAQFTATLMDAGGNVLTDRVVTWSSGVPTLASVSPTGGLVTGVAVGGPVTITATSETKGGSAQVTVTAAENPAILTGRVIDYTTQAGIGGATVTFLGAGAAQTTTGADGTFTSPGLTGFGTTGILVEASRSGYVTGSVLAANVSPGFTSVAETIPLVPTSSNTGGISGTVKNARTGAGVASASVGLYNFSTSADLLATRATDAGGSFSFTGLAAGTYLLNAIATGFQEGQRVGVAVGDNGVTAGQDVVLSPTGSNDIRIVLTWGASPSDLDSHLTGPNADASRFHVYYSSRGNLTASPFALLDLDDTSSFGPETITINQFNSSTGVYRYSVHDFSNRSSTTSSALGLSGAKVDVYLPTGLAYSFAVPSGAGTLWTVFEMSGSITDPVVTPRNTMSFNTSTGGTVGSPPADGSVAATDAALIGDAVRQHPETKP